MCGDAEDARLLGLGSYQTAWVMMHRYRTAMVRPHREVLTGRVEVNYRLLQYAAGAAPLTYRKMVANSPPKAVKPPGVTGERSKPGTLTRPPEDRPWRATHTLE